MLQPQQCHPQTVPPAHTTLILDRLLARLDSLADTSSIEHFRCLLGKYRHDTVFIVTVWEPPILHADYNTVTAGACPSQTVGTWHNHLPYNIPMNDPHNRQTKVEPWSVCELSPPDRLSNLQEPWALSMISVANGVHCAWQRVGQGDSIYFQRLPWAVP